MLKFLFGKITLTVCNQCHRVKKIDTWAHLTETELLKLSTRTHEVVSETCPDCICGEVYGGA